MILWESPAFYGGVGRFWEALLVSQGLKDLAPPTMGKL